MNCMIQQEFPYARLDKRALDFARRSAVKNSKRILEEIDAHNDAIEKNMQDKLLKKALSQCL